MSHNIQVESYADQYDSDEPLGSNVSLTTSALKSLETSAIAWRESCFEEEELCPLQNRQADQTRELVPRLIHSFGDEASHEALCCAVSPDGHAVAAGCRDGRVRVVASRPGGGLLHTLGDPNPHVSEPSCTALRWRPETWHAGETRNVLIACKGGEVLHVHATSGFVLSRTDEGGNHIHCLATCADEPMFATAGDDRGVRVYDARGARLVADLRDARVGSMAAHAHASPEGHSNSVYAVAWVPSDCNLLLSGGWDNTVLAWDLRARRPARSIFGPHICGDALDARNGEVLTGSWRERNPLQLWDLGTGRLRTNLPLRCPDGEPTLLYSAKFAPSGDIVAGGSGRRPALHVMPQSRESLGAAPAESPVHAVDVHQTAEAAVAVAGCAREILCVEL
uniref:Wd repeat protein n=1 Tax=Tetraselmis sp. GSL018 TaxID=582737 RepID=A0A061SGK6_9CHLO|mmetsp:Transcript_24346/g.58041  ORF Transcript_24346/g.58041 Transcript_24346/m.58041 type:complete len:394 (+) Transcript_24346:141-1322(+)